PDDVDKWWHLRLQIYAICFLIFCLIAAIKQKGDVKFILYIVMALIVGDVWDRLTTPGIATFVNSDYILIGILLIIIILYVRNKFRNAKQLRHKARNNNLHY